MRINRTGDRVSLGGGASQRSVGEMRRGETFSATVSGVSGNEVTLSMSGGHQFSAKTRNPGRLKKGQKMSFVVEGNEKGQVFVRISDGTAEKDISFDVKA